ncbi:MAG: DUF4401 domain-containing protein [Casimicrobiaceae bacterium]
MNWSTLFQALQAAGVSNDASIPAFPPAGTATPWVSRVLLGVCGWIAGLLALISLGAIIYGMFNNAATLFGVALVALGVTTVLYRTVGRNELLLQFALATSIAGQLAFAAALLDVNWNSTRTIALAMAALQALLVVIMPNAVHRFLSTLFTAIALGIAAFELHAMPILALGLSLATVVVWLSETRWQCAGYAKWMRPIAYALAIALLGLPMASPETSFWGLGHARLHVDPWAALAYLPASALLLWGLVRNASVGARLGAVAGCVALVAVAAYAPGVTVAILVALLGFGAGSMVLVGTALCAAVAYLGVYYYLLESSLLVKAIALMLSGVGCWLARGLVRALKRGEAQ